MLCKAECLNDDTCVAVSQGVYDSTPYCIGCQVPLWFDFEGATAYEKVQTSLRRPTSRLALPDILRS